MLEKFCHTITDIYCTIKETINIRTSNLSCTNYFEYILVNGGWSPWSAWTECRCPGATLAAGKMSTRTCTNPPPSNGGLQCQGSGVRRTKDCIQCPQGNYKYNSKRILVNCKL